MQLEENTKNELKKVILEYQSKEMSETYIYDLATILNHVSFFEGKICAKSNHKVQLMEINDVDLIIEYNMETLVKRFSQLYNKHKKYNVERNELIHYLISFSFLHEIDHLFQILCAKEDISFYSEINDLYKRIILALKNSGKVDQWKYRFFPNWYCHERNANIFAADFLEEVFRDTNLSTYARLWQINSMFKWSYSLKEGKVISPVDRTLKFLHIHDEIFSKNLPFDVAFSHGFPISEEDYHSIYDDFLKNRKRIHYDETMRRIRRLDNKEIHNK